MKKAIPDNAKIAKDAKETVQECVSEFISFITSEASEKCTQERRKTINGDDILKAMEELGFDAYIDPLREYLKRFREDQKMNEKGGSKVCRSLAVFVSSLFILTSLYFVSGKGSPGAR